MESLFQLIPTKNGMGGNVVSQVKAFFVREFGKYFIFKFSLFAKSPASPANLVNLGIFVFLGKSVSNTYSDNADTKFGLCSPTLKPFWANKASTTLAILFWPS